MKYRNPIIPGFSPDPSIVLVGSTFFLVTSSFQVFPGLPIYASHDLREWKLIGNAYNRPDQLSLTFATTDVHTFQDGTTIIVTGGLYAPTIRHHEGRFYIVCTNVTTQATEVEQENFILSCSEADIWTSEIDPDLFFEDGRCYVQGSWTEGPSNAPRCDIRGYEIDVATGTRLSYVRLLWNGWAGEGNAEGPHIYKKDGWYWLVTAERGTWERHCLCVARSRHLQGPCEACNKNPILTTYEQDGEIGHAGHGDLIEDTNGRWWCVFLGVRRGNAKLSTPLGRETFIVLVTWHKDQQPKIEAPCMDFEIEDTKASSVSLIKSIIADERSQWVHVRTPSLPDYNIVNDRSLRLKPRRARLSCETESPTFVGKRQRLIETISAVRLSSTECKSEAGLAVYEDPQQFATISFDSNDGTIHFEVQTPSRKARSIAQWSWEDGKDVMFKIQATKEAYFFLYGLQLEKSEQRWI
ncbi:hypothetical protein LCI18_012878 [Fusarium solani-melongenae]|uniref:Uncharacterized protein n=1 Tax=Fusarium solani subsp. cucurbitae TaxID=2747967 RepID=A0ACD3ZPB8_FUSSC|nr:hypothetical protein LCI18_012878 [Fusarium solani-melongenae]